MQSILRTLSMVLLVSQTCAFGALNTVKVPDALSAAYEPYSNRVFVAAGGRGVDVLDADGEKRVTNLSLEGRALEVIRLGDHMVVISVNENTIQITEIDPMKLEPTARSFNMVWKSFSLEAAVALDNDHIFLLQKQTHQFGGLVISLKDRKISQEVGRTISGLIYDKAILSVRGKALLIPSAYPGQVVKYEIGANAELNNKATLNVKDWIHQVTQINQDQAIVAGHLSGVSLIELKPDPAKPERLLIADRRTHSIVLGTRMITVSPTHIYDTDLGTLNVKTTLLQLGDKWDEVLPLGVTEKGRVMILHLENAVVFSDL